MKPGPMSQVVAPESFGNEEFYGLPDELPDFISEQFFEASVCQHDLTLRVNQDHAVGRSFHSQPKPFLSLLAVGDVEARTDVSEERAICGEARRPIVQHPAIFAVTSSQTVFHRERLPAIKGVSIDLKTSVEIFAMNTLCPPMAKLLLQAPTRKVEPTLVEKVAQLIRAGHPDHHRRCVSQGAKTSLAFP